MEEKKCLDMSKIGLTEIDGSLFNAFEYQLCDLETLKLNGNKITLIEENTFANLSSLKTLFLNNNKLENTDWKIFKGLINLEILSLNNNKLTTIKPSLFEALSNLQELNLFNNKLEKIDVNTFKGLNKLEKLYLNKNGIHELKDNVFEELVNLRELSLFDNKLKVIGSKTFEKLTNLEILHLNDNEIKEIDVRLFENLSILRELYLNNNKLETINSNTFKRLAKLEKLSLNNNGLTAIFFFLFEGLLNLVELNLFNNRITNIEANAFKGLWNLGKLYLNRNEIMELNANAFEGLSNLKELNLSDNKLQEINPNAFEKTNQLQILNLSNNEIEELNVGLNLENLIELHLNNNKLKRIDSNLFQGLKNLNVLLLNDNELIELDFSLFSTLSNLRSLCLNNNKLKDIDTGFFDNLNTIGVIQLYGNDFKARSYLKISNVKSILYHDMDELNKTGFLSDWNEFLKQFRPIIECKIEEIMEVKEQFPEACNTLNFSELEEEIIIKEERDNINNTSQSSSNQSTERDKQFRDPYIGELFNDRYKVVRQLEKGIYGSVYLVNDTKLDIKRKKLKAMKIMDKLDPVKEKELEFLSNISHRNIERYLDHYEDTRMIGQKYQTFLITEYCKNGDLRNKIEENKRLKRDFKDRQILDWIIQATNALTYIHSIKPNPIIHSDIKPENMLLSERNEIKLADLGMSKLWDKTHAYTYLDAQQYMSPELITSQFTDIKYYPNTDIWSLGCVLYELIFLRTAFPRGQRGDPAIPSSLSSTGIFSSILSRMLEKDCLKRIKSRKLLKKLRELENLFDD